MLYSASSISNSGHDVTASHLASRAGVLQGMLNSLFDELKPAMG